MSIIRTSKREIAYFDRTVLNDERLTWKAKGIASYLLSHGDGWEISTEDLWRTSKDGRDSVLSGLKELERGGYLERSKRKDAKTGQWVWDKVLHEVPIPTSEDSPCPENPDTGNPDTENQGIKEGTSYLEGNITETSPKEERKQFPGQLMSIMFGVHKTSDGKWPKVPQTKWQQVHSHSKRMWDNGIRASDLHRYMAWRKQNESWKTSRPRPSEIETWFASEDNPTNVPVQEQIVEVWEWT